jgi:hypothetical protein
MHDWKNQTVKLARLRIPEHYRGISSNPNPHVAKWCLTEIETGRPDLLLQFEMNIKQK